MKVQGISKFTTSILFVVTLLLAPFVSVKPASADIPNSITNYTVAESVGVVTGDDGNVWTLASTLKKVSRVSTTGAVSYFPFPTGTTYSLARNLTQGPDGAIWFSVHRPYASSYPDSAYSIMRVDESGNYTVYDLPPPQDNKGSSTTGVNSLAFVEGKLWISRNSSCYIQILSPGSGSVKTLKISKPSAVLPVNYCNNPSVHDFKAGYSPKAIIANPYDRSTLIITQENSYSNGSNVTAGGTYVERINREGQRTVYSLGYTPADFNAINEVLFDSQQKLWFSTSFGKFGYFDPINASANIYTMPMPQLHMALGPDGSLWFTGKSGYDFSVYKYNIATSSTITYPMNGSSTGNTPSKLTWGPDSNLWVVHSSHSIINKMNFGTMPNNDSDSDGLTYFQELQQGTSDFTADTDNDGLTDYTESQWNTNRDAVFCNATVTTCEYPDPLQQDIYIETDWMQRPNDGPIVGYSTQPNQNSVDMIKTAFSNKSIKAHVDTGQLGGGNEVPYNEGVQFAGGHDSGVIDFWDYRDGDSGGGIAQQFATNRKDIYHYMLMGHHMSDSGYTTTTGASVTGTDDAFISYGLIKENPGSYSFFDVAIAGTMHHELGHTLCLSNTHDYTGQAASCTFTGVDQLGTSDYPSSMNYLYQQVLVDYSDGTNSANDHDDWSVISPKDFTWNEALDVLSPGATIEQLNQAQKIRKDKGIKVEQKNGKFEVTQTQNGRTKRLN